MNLLVQSFAALSVLAEDTADSIARIEVVPTAQTLRFFFYSLVNDVRIFLGDDELLRVHFVFR